MAKSRKRHCSLRDDKRSCRQMSTAKASHWTCSGCFCLLCLFSLQQSQNLTVKVLHLHLGFPVCGDQVQFAPIYYTDEDTAGDIYKGRLTHETRMIYRFVFYKFK